MSRQPAPGGLLLGTFAHLDALLLALRRCREERITVDDVYSPVPSEKILEQVSPGQSRVRFFTFGGAAAGLATGLGLALLTSAVWELHVAGKPVYSLVPFMVVGFELTILLGALLTLGGLLYFARLPFCTFPAPGYRPVFSDDRFGLLLRGTAEQLQRGREILEQAGALELEAVSTERQPARPAPRRDP